MITMVKLKERQICIQDGSSLQFTCKYPSDLHKKILNTDGLPRLNSMYLCIVQGLQFFLHLNFVLGA